MTRSEAGSNPSPLNGCRVSGSATVNQAVGHGKATAAGIDKYLRANGR